MQWDNEADEPFIQVTEDIRITPVRLTDVDKWVTQGFCVRISLNVAPG